MSIKTIAEKAGVSTATVSNVINGNYHKVSEETRARIESIIAEMNYKPSAVARSLAGTESHLIALVVPYINMHSSFESSPYYAHIIAALEQYVRNRGYYLMLRCAEDVQEIIPLLTAWNVDGAFFLGISGTDVSEIRHGLHAPLVFLDTYSDEKIVNIGIDDYRGGFLSARYLIGKGHRRIALVSPDHKHGGVIGERFRGFTDACAEASLSFSEEDVFYSDTYYEKGIAVGQDIVLSGRSYTAAAAMADIVAIGMLEGFRQCGVRVPEDMSVIGFDNIPEGALVTPKLTTIEQDFHKKARLAGDYLFRMIEGDTSVFVNQTMEIHVLERDSVQSVL